MFFIPETQKEIKALINEIVERNTATKAVDKVDYFYTIALLEAFYNNEINALK